MINLIKNELTKIFHKKAIYVVLIITLAIMILGGILDKMFFNNEGIFDVDNTEYIKEELSALDKNNPNDKDLYISLQAELQTIELANKYEKGSWQEYIVNEKALPLIQDMLMSEGTASYVESKKAYDEFIEKLNTNNWKAFAEADLKEINEEIKDLETNENSNLTQPDVVLEDSDEEQVLASQNMMSEENKKQALAALKDNKQVIEWRLQKDIAYGDSTLNEAIENRQSIKAQLRDYENKTKTKELEYSEKYDKQQLEAELALCEYAIQNDLNKNVKLNSINNQTALASNADVSLIETFSSCLLFITIAIVIIAGTSVSEEFNKGTIKSLLVRPHSRLKILTAKFIACLIVLFVMYIAIALLQAVGGGFVYGFGSYTGQEIIYNFNTGSIETIGIFKYLLLSGAVLLPEFLLIMTLAFALSVIFNNSAIAIAFPLFGMMGADLINAAAYAYKKAEFLKFFVTPNWDFKIYLFGKMTEFEPITLTFSAIVCAIYFIIMIVTSAIVFKKREVKNI